MTISHHPTPEVLAEFASGRLTPGAMLVLGCHLEACRLCRAEIAAYESMGGHFLEELNPTPLAADALDKTLALLEQEPTTGAAPPVVSRQPRYLSRYALPTALQRQRVGSRRWVTPNIWFAPIELKGSPSLTYLLYGRPGTVLSRHTHRGREFTAVLHGSFHDSAGQFDCGDFEEADASLLHAPTVQAASDCLCIIDAEAPMVMSGRAARLVQTVLGRVY